MGDKSGASRNVSYCCNDLFCIFTNIDKFEMFRKDARLPENLQRAMAAEAEAAREARAKVTS